MPKSADRVLLEGAILPFFAAQADYRRILLVGCDRRTAAYPDFFKGKDCWTLERLRSRARFGGRRHVCGDVRRLEGHFPPRRFDAILLNGLLGYGLNAPQDAEAAYVSCYRALRRGGVLLVGWNQFSTLRALAPDASKGLRRFRRHRLAALGGWRRRVDFLLWQRGQAGQGGPALRARRWNHVFDCYRKP